MTLQTIQELRELEGKATPGEWDVSGDDGSGLDVAIFSSALCDYVIHTGLEGDGGVGTHRDAAVICSLRNNAKALLDMAEWALENGYPQLTTRDGGEVQ